jgi:tripartite-type tricarboxylate transporter receptor subunit TctC
MNKRKFLRYFAGLMPGAGLLAARAQDASFPIKPIRIIVASAPGALADQATRFYAERMSVYLKQPIIVENIAGGGTLLASRQLLKALPDGYTLLTNSNTLVTAPLLNRNAGFSIKDYTAVGELARSPSVLVVSGASPFQSLADLVSAAKKNPGQISYGSGGIGSAGHLPVEIFSRQAGINLTHVPYKGMALAVPDVAGNRVSFLMGAATATAELMKTGALRPLAITSEVRSPKFPNVPTFKELGYPDAGFEIWIGMVGPAGLPRDVKARLAEALEAARADQCIVSRLEAAGQVISHVRTPEQFEGFMRGEQKKLRRIVKELNVTID